MRTIAFCALLFLAACVRPHQGPIETKITTFPHGGIVEINGHAYGKEPYTLALPQDSSGRLTTNVVIRALPREDGLYPGTKILDPAKRVERVPSKVMVDMTVIPDSSNKVDLVQYQERIEKRVEKEHQKPGVKPTKPVGGY